MTICPICKSDKAFCNCSPTHILAGPTELQTLREENARLNTRLLDIHRAIGEAVAFAPSPIDGIKALFEDLARVTKERDSFRDDKNVCWGQLQKSREIVERVTQERDKARSRLTIAIPHLCPAIDEAISIVQDCQEHEDCRDLHRLVAEDGSGLLKEFRKQVISLRSQLTAANEEITNWKITAHDYKCGMKEANEACVKAEEDRDAFGSELRDAHQRIDQLETDRDSLRAQLQQAESTRDEYAGKIMALEEEIEVATCRLADERDAALAKLRAAMAGICVMGESK